MDRDTVIRLAREAGVQPIQEFALMGAWVTNTDAIQRFAALVAAAEREACAKVCDSSIHDTYIGGHTGAIHSARRECAAAIRARSTNEVQVSPR